MKINDLPEVLLGEVIRLVGPGEYRYVAGVNHLFRSVYDQVFKDSHTTADSSVVQSVDRVQIWMNEAPNTPEKRLLAFPSIADSAAEIGQLQVLQWLKAVGTFQFQFTQTLYCAAAKNGHVHVLKWCQDNNVGLLDEYTCAHAALGGQLTVIKWLRAHGCPWSARTCWYASLGGHLHVLQYARAQGCPWDSYTCTYAAESGNLAVLRWAKEHGCPWNHKTCTEAVRKGHLETLKFAIENGCPYNEDRCISYARQKGHTAIVDWLCRAK